MLQEKLPYFHGLFFTKIEAKALEYCVARVKGAWVPKSLCGGESFTAHEPVGLNP